jgi:hypothetical protein
LEGRKILDESLRKDWNRRLLGARCPHSPDLTTLPKSMKSALWHLLALLFFTVPSRADGPAGSIILPGIDSGGSTSQDALEGIRRKTRPPEKPEEVPGKGLPVRRYAFSRAMHRKLLAVSPDPNLRSALEFQGIPFPEGSTVSWDERGGGRLSVRNTPENLDLLEALLEGGTVFAGEGVRIGLPGEP